MNATVSQVRAGAVPGSLPNETSIDASGLNLKGEVLHKPLQPFFQWVNGKLKPKDKNNLTLFEITNGAPLNVTKAAWGLTPILQAIGLVNENAGKLARAFYGVCWSIVYTCYRPWAANRKELPEHSSLKKITDGHRSLYNANEHFRVGMGTLVSGVYGCGAFGMLWSWFKGDDDLFDKAANVYQMGMFNQNQIFESMNYADVLKRKFISSELEDFEKNDKNAKATIEKVDSVLFIPSIITRGLDTCRLFGAEFGEITQRIINVFSYVGYGTWAARFGLLKQTEYSGIDCDGKDARGDGVLDDINPNLKGGSLKTEQILYDTQKYGGRAFYTLLPGLSWLAAGAELFGLREFAQSAFQLEGILERLNPAIASWCIRSTWLRLFEKK